MTHTETGTYIEIVDTEAGTYIEMETYINTGTHRDGDIHRDFLTQRATYTHVTYHQKEKEKKQ